MRLTILATMLALSTSMAFAQDNDFMADMSAGLTMLESSASAAFKKYGIEGDVMALTLSQLAEIQGVMTGSNSDEEKKAGIQAALQK